MKSVFFVALSMLATVSALPTFANKVNIASCFDAFEANPSLESTESPVFALRGGALGVTKENALTSTFVVASLYGLQFLLKPDFVISQNFKIAPDKYHEFFGRFSGATMLILLYGLKQMSTDSAFNVSFIWNGVIALLGPVFAEIFLETTPMHTVTAPIFVGGVLLLHVLASV